MNKKIRVILNIVGVLCILFFFIHLGLFNFLTSFIFLLIGFCLLFSAILLEDDGKCN
jgi:hypothetical protein